MKTMTQQPQGTTIETLASGRRVYVTATGRVVGAAPKAIEIDLESLRADERAAQERERELLSVTIEAEENDGVPHLLERYDDGLSNLFETDESHGRTSRWA